MIVIGGIQSPSEFCLKVAEERCFQSEMCVTVIQIERDVAPIESDSSRIIMYGTGVVSRFFDKELMSDGISGFRCRLSKYCTRNRFRPSGKLVQRRPRRNAILYRSDFVTVGDKSYYYMRSNCCKCFRDASIKGLVC